MSVNGGAKAGRCGDTGHWHAVPGGGYVVLGASLATVGRVGTGAIAAALLCEYCTASPEQMARQGAGVLSSIDHDDAVDDHHVDAVGVLVRIVEAGAIGNRLRVE